MVSESSREPSREIRRSKPIAGGKRTCSRCSELRANGSAYCAVHRNEYQQGWRRSRTAEYHALKNQSNFKAVEGEKNDGAPQE